MRLSLRRFGPSRLGQGSREKEACGRAAPSRVGEQAATRFAGRRVAASISFRVADTARDARRFHSMRLEQARLRRRRAGRKFRRAWLLATTSIKLATVDLGERRGHRRLVRARGRGWGTTHQPIFGGGGPGRRPPTDQRPARSGRSGVQTIPWHHGPPRRRGHSENAFESRGSRGLLFRVGRRRSANVGRRAPGDSGRVGGRRFRTREARTSEAEAASIPSRVDEGVAARRQNSPLPATDGDSGSEGESRLAHRPTSERRKAGAHACASFSSSRRRGAALTEEIPWLAPDVRIRCRPPEPASSAPSGISGARARGRPVSQPWRCKRGSRVDEHRFPARAGGLEIRRRLVPARPLEAHRVGGGSLCEPGRREARPAPRDRPRRDRRLGRPAGGRATPDAIPPPDAARRGDGQKGAPRAAAPSRTHRICGGRRIGWSGGS